jgi:hypothetical protein
VTVLADGRLVAAGEADRQILLARFSSRGRLDPTFGSNGIRIVPRGRHGRGETATDIGVLPDRSLLVSGEARSAVDAYADDVRIVIARITRDGGSVREAVSRVRLGTNGEVAGQAARPHGAWVVGMRQDGRLVLARVDRRGRFDARFGRAGVQIRTLHRLPDVLGGTVAGVAPMSGGGVVVAATLFPDVEIQMPNGDLVGDRRETPVVAIFDNRGRPVTSACSPSPILPTGAWAAQFTSAVPADSGVVVSGWTRPPPTESNEPEDGTAPPTLPVVFRLILP